MLVKNKQVWLSGMIATSSGSSLLNLHHDLAEIISLKVFYNMGAKFRRLPNLSLTSNEPNTANATIHWQVICVVFFNLKEHVF